MPPTNSARDGAQSDSHAPRLIPSGFLSSRRRTLLLAAQALAVLALAAEIAHTVFNLGDPALNGFFDNYVYNGLIGVLFGWPHRDINFSFKLMKREVLKAIDLKSEGSLIDAELIVKARNHGFFIQQIGLDYFPRVLGTSHLSGLDVIMKIFRELFSLYPEMRRRVPRGEPRVSRGDSAAETAAAPQ